MTLFVMPGLYAITTDLRRVVLKDPEGRFRSISDEKLLSASIPADD